jgi:hypothetical protein
MTTVRIEDEEGASDKLNDNILAVERAAGHSLKNIITRSPIAI